MKRIAALTSMALLLAACGSQPQPTISTPDSSGFMVAGKPDFKARKVILPATQTLPWRAVTSQSLRSASLPAWTGPTTFQMTGDHANIATNSSGALFFQRFTDYRNGPKLTKFTPNGQLVGEQTFPITAGFNPRRSWVVVTEDSPTEEAYQIASDSYHLSKRTQILSDSMQVLNTNSDGPTYPLDGTAGTDEPQNENSFKPGKKGIVMLANHKFGDLNPRVDVYELSHEPWDNVETDQRSTFFPPKRYRNNNLAADISTSNDGSIYLAMFSSYIANCHEICPSVAGISKLVNGEVVWQVYWDADQPIRLNDISATNTGVSLLVAQEDAIGNTPHILTFNSNGDPQSDKQIPLDALRQQYSEMQIDNFDRLELG